MVIVWGAGRAAASHPLISNPEDRVPWCAIRSRFFRENRFDRTHTHIQRESVWFQGEYGGKKTELTIEVLNVCRGPRHPVQNRHPKLNPKLIQSRSKTRFRSQHVQNNNSSLNTYTPVHTRLIITTADKHGFDVSFNLQFYFSSFNVL